MFELIQTGRHTYYFDLPSKIGVYTPDDKNVYLIDSGPHKDNAKKVLRIPTPMPTTSVATVICRIRQAVLFSHRTKKPI